MNETTRSQLKDYILTIFQEDDPNWADKYLDKAIKLSEDYMSFYDLQDYHLLEEGVYFHTMVLYSKDLLKNNTFFSFGCMLEKQKSKAGTVFLNQGLNRLDLWRDKVRKFGSKKCS